MDSIDEFFAQYPEFDYDRKASSPREFYRMCDFFGWVKDDQDRYPRKRNEAYKDFRRAMVVTFNSNFGTNVDDRRAWEKLCALLGIEPLPESVKEMKKKVKSTHVNLSDLLDGDRAGKGVRVFKSEAALAEYTRREGRFFPKEEAYAGGVLRFLLREITGQYEGGKRR